MYNLITILDWVRYATSSFRKANLYYGHGTSNALDDAAALVLGSLELPVNLDIQYWQASTTEAERKTIEDNIKLRIEKRLPTPYIIKQIMYGGYEFYIDERALIPRSPIAELIDQQFQPYIEDFYPEHILDLCCGSGCIGILAKQYFVDSLITLADIDDNALSVAKKNIKQFDLHPDEVEVIQGDLFENIDQRYELILCNPPYVEAGELDDIADEYLHEPKHALISGNDGLDIVRIILKTAADYLTDDGYLVLEVGMTWPILEAEFPDIGFGWVEFNNGGEGVLIVSKDELIAWNLAGLIS